MQRNGVKRIALGKSSLNNGTNKLKICQQEVINISIENHQKDYIKDSWKEYTVEELIQWVSLLTRRASHRTNREKMKKDLYDARNYMLMLEEVLEEDAQ